MTPVYLDNAATSYPKPHEVIKSVVNTIVEKGGNPGRASHILASRAADEIYKARVEVSELFSSQPERVAFTLNATYALNMAIKGLTPMSSNILISNMEHNSVLRPVSALSRWGVSYDIFDIVGRASDDVEGVISSISKKLAKKTAVLITTHRSNILPVEAPLEAIGEFCNRNGIIFIVDASQSAGAIDIDMKKCKISALAAPSHKGLYGVQGAGFVVFGEGFLPKSERLATIIEGGSGSDSENREMPSELPDRLEAGTLPTEVISGLRAGISFVKKKGLKNIDDYERSLSSYMKKRLEGLSKIRVYLPERNVGGTVLFNCEGYSPSAVSEYLDSVGVATRSGLHCAPLAHRYTGTEKKGAVRASVGVFNTYEDIDILVSALSKLG